MTGLEYKKERVKKHGGVGTKYEPEFKLKLANEAIECGNVSAIARKYDIATQTIDNWVKLVKVKGIRE